MAQHEARETGLLEAVVHIGLHKTGTTAFQEALDLAANDLLEHDVRVMHYDGPMYPGTPRSQAIELANAVVRLDIDAYFRLCAPESLLSSVLLSSELHVHEQSQAPGRLLVASMEGLSLVSSRDEVLRLVDVLHPRKVRVVVVLRDKAAYLASLRLQLVRLGLHPNSPYPDSCLYLEDDSW